MIPGEVITQPGEIELNQGRPQCGYGEVNTGDRPIQVGLIFTFMNEALNLTESDHGNA